MELSAPSRISAKRLIHLYIFYILFIEYLYIIYTGEAKKYFVPHIVDVIGKVLKHGKIKLTHIQLRTDGFKKK